MRCLFLCVSFVIPANADNIVLVSISDGSDVRGADEADTSSIHLRRIVSRIRQKLCRHKFRRRLGEKLNWVFVQCVCVRWMQREENFCFCPICGDRHNWSNIRNIVVCSCHMRPTNRKFHKMQNCNQFHCLVVACVCLCVCVWYDPCLVERAQLCLF